MRSTTRLRQLIDAPEILVAPGAHDALSARLIERQGFAAVYVTGAGAAAALLGEPDLGLLTMSEMVAHAGRISGCVSVPVIADADTGYGGIINVMRTVREYERAGIAGIHLEDQQFPKRCGHLDGKSVIAKDEFAAKIRAAVDSRSDPDFVIIARTDARAVTGLDDAIERGKLYRDAGADVVFVEAPTDRAELERIAAAIDAPLLCNQVPGGKTPAQTPAELERIGYDIVIYPLASISSATLSIERALAALQATGYQSDVVSPLELFGRVGLDAWLGASRRYAPG